MTQNAPIADDSVLCIPEVPLPTRTRVLGVSSIILVMSTLCVLEFLWYTPWWAWAIPVILILLTVLTWPTPDVLVDIRRRRVARPPVSDLGFDEITRVELLPTVIADSLPNRRLTKGPAWAVVLRGRLEGRGDGAEPYRDQEIPESVLGREDHGRPLDAVLVTAQHPLGSGFAWAKHLARVFGVPLRVDLGDLRKEFAFHELDQDIEERCAGLGKGSVGSPPPAVLETVGPGSLKLEWKINLVPQAMLWGTIFLASFVSGGFVAGSGLPPLARAVGCVVLGLSSLAMWRLTCTLMFLSRCTVEIDPDRVRTVCGRRWLPIQTLPLDEVELVHGQTPRPGASPEVGSPKTNAVIVLGDHRSSELWAPMDVALWIPQRVHQFLGP